MLESHADEDIMPIDHQTLALTMAENCPFWNAQQWHSFWMLPADEQAAMATIMNDSPASPTTSGWTKALAVATQLIGVAGTVVGLGTTVETGMQVIEGLASL